MTSINTASFRLVQRRSKVGADGFNGFPAQETQGARARASLDGKRLAAAS